MPLSSRFSLPLAGLVLACALLTPVAPAAQAADPKPTAAVAIPRGAALEQAIKTKRIKNVVWKDLAFKDAVAWLRVATGWNFVVNQTALAKASVDTTAITFNAEFSDISLATLLEVLLEPHAMAVRIQDNLIWLTTKADAWGKLVTRLYGISHITWQKIDFAAPDIHLNPSGFTPTEEYEPEKLVEDDPLLSGDAVADLVKEIVAPGQWETDGWTIRATKQYLVIRAPEKVQAKVPRALATIASLK
jgi:hypothetical protein